MILTITIDAETPHLCPWFDRPNPSLMATGLVDDGMEVYGMVFHGLAGFGIEGRVLGLHWEEGYGRTISLRNRLILEILNLVNYHPI